MIGRPRVDEEERLLPHITSLNERQRQFVKKQKPNGSAYVRGLIEADMQRQARQKKREASNEQS